MKNISQRFKYVIAAPLFLIASLVLSFAQVEFASAATLTWDGSSGDGKFSTDANWSTNSAPVDGDVLNFDASTLSGDVTLDNDITDLSVAGINFSGDASSGLFGSDLFTIDGNAITLTGSVTNTSTYSPDVLPAVHVLALDITLGANATMTNVSIPSGGSLNTQTYSIGWAGTSLCALGLTGVVSGSGALNISATEASLTGNNASYTGAITITQGMTYISPAGLGSSSAGTTVSGSGKLSIYSASDVTIAEPLTLSGTGSLGSQGGSTNGCSGASVADTTTTLSGAVTLQSNFTLDSQNDVVITGTYTSNGHVFSVKGGSNGTLTTPEGVTEVPSEELEYSDSQPSESETVGNKQTGILNGSRDEVYVNSGGVLKGTGTVNRLFVNDGGVVNPGQSPGQLTVLEDLSLGGSYEAELLNGDTYDQLRVGEGYTSGGSAVTLNSGATLATTLYDGWSVSQGDQFMIIDNRHSSAVSGTFNGLAEGAQFDVTNEDVTITFSITYEGGDGNDVVITALNAGEDPTPPNTGVAQLILGNPVIVVVLGVVTVALLALAIRRRQTS